jgi:hypothetical protein
MSIFYNSRRDFLRGVATAACASACGSLIAAEGGNKLAKEAAQYQEEPKDGERCSGCVFFIPEDNTCKLVQGSISPEGWCSLYQPRS